MTAPSEPDEPDRRVSLVVAAVVYGGILVAGCAWLSARDRGDQIAVLAIGERGPWLGCAAGLVVGWLGARAFALATGRSKHLRATEDAARLVFRGVDERVVTAFVLFAVIAEELFFRLAVQDAFGLPGAVAAYALLHSCTVGFGALPFAVAHAVVLGLLVQHGFGLLGCTTAHAIMNHLTLRRILCT